MYVFSPYILLHPLAALFGHPVSQTLVEIILRYQTKRRKGKFHIWSVGYQNMVKRARGVHFWRSFLKIFKNEEEFGFDIFEKGQILRPFSGLAPSNLSIFSKEINGSIWAYKVFYMPIFRRSEGGGGLESPPPQVLAVLKKAWSWEGNAAF